VQEERKREKEEGKETQSIKARPSLLRDKKRETEK